MDAAFSRTTLPLCLLGLLAGPGQVLTAQANDVVIQNDVYVPNMPTSAQGTPVCVDAQGRLVADCDAVGPPNQLSHFDQFAGMPCTSSLATPGTIEIVYGADYQVGFRCVPDVIPPPPTPSTCDTGLALDDTDAGNAAKAIELCQTTTPGTGSGVISASYVRANGTVVAPGLQTGLTPLWGINVPPRAGERMLVLSSGRARDANDTGFCGSHSCNGVGAGAPPPGFPLATPSCPTPLSNIFDDVGLELVLRAPDSATGFAFDFSYYTFDYPNWVCDQYNDQAIALVSPAPAASVNGDIALDAGAPISVNVSFLEVCSGCALGNTDLIGTGFDTNGATGWMTTTAPITGGEEFTLRLTLWDTGDQNFDSTLLIDNFRWLTDPTVVSTTRALNP